MIGVGTYTTTDRARRYVNEVLSSDRLSYGPFTQKFERLFAAAHHSRYAIMTNSGTCSLMIALAALKNRYGWQDGDEVIVPAVTFIATSNIVLQLNLRPVFVDVDPVFYELDPSKIEAAIGPKTRCIIPVHLFGCPCDMEPIMAIAAKNKLRVIEDSCETMFTKLGGKSVGSFGDIGCFSTYVAHILTTGVGGLCTTNDPDLAIQLRSLMNHGRDSIYLSIDDDKDKSQEEMEMIIPRRFSFVQMGYSFRVTELEGALGLAQFEEHELMMQKRLENGHYFMEKLARFGDRIQLPTLRNDAGHAFMMFPVVLKGAPKIEMVRYLEGQGIETRDMLPLINQPFYQDLFDIKKGDYPVADWINESGFYIGSHQGLSEIEKEYVVETFENYFLHKNIRKQRSCLILLSKGESHSAQLIGEQIPLGMFDERVLVEASPKSEIPYFFRKNDFQILHKEGGKGALLREAVAMTNCENIVLMGLDGSDDPKDIDSLLIRLKQGNDLVVASRFLPEGGRQSARPLSYRALGNRFFSFLLAILFGRNLTDCNNLFRGFKRKFFDTLELSENGECIMFEMTLKSLYSTGRFVESPTNERPGIQRNSKRNRFLTALGFFGILFRHFFSARFWHQAILRPAMGT